LTDLHAWLIDTRKTIAKGTRTAKALDYSLNRWPALLRYADSGILRLIIIPSKHDPSYCHWKKELVIRRFRTRRVSCCGDSKSAGNSQTQCLNPADWLQDHTKKLPTWPNSGLMNYFPSPPIPLR